MTIYEQGQQLPPHESCDNCANPMWCKIQGTCNGHRLRGVAELKQAEMDGYCASMAEFGLTVTAHADERITVTGPREAWRAYLNSLEESWKDY